MDVKFSPLVLVPDKAGPETSALSLLEATSRDCTYDTAVKQ